MKRLGTLVVLVLFLAGCGFNSAAGQTIAGGNGGSSVHFVHDTAHKVSCWTLDSSISCLPDSQVTLP